MSVLSQIEALKIVPVIKIEKASDVTALADALIAGGLGCAEITFRSTAAREAISNIANHKNILVGAGTVLSVDTAKQAIEAGAKFIVAPGFNPKVVRYCMDQKVPIAPGVCTPTDIEMALEHGLEVLKFFPAEAFGGLKTLKAISAPYGKVKFIPTGGVNAGNLQAYLAFSKVLACGGTWIATPDLINNGKFEEITRLTKEAVRIASS